MKNIVLIGFMGTGKTCVGQLVAEELGWPFVDLDLEVEKAIDAYFADIRRTLPLVTAALATLTKR